MKVKIKKLHPDAVIPSYAKIGDAGLDLTAVEDFDVIDYPSRIIEYRTGLAIQIPTGFVGLIFPRSSICLKDLMLTNSVGVIDSGYTGEIKFRFKTSGANLYEKGDRIGQLIIIPYPTVQFEEVEELTKTERGDGGFGSSGK